jgi:hypothetical protein
VGATGAQGATGVSGGNDWYNYVAAGPVNFGNQNLSNIGSLTAYDANITNGNITNLNGVGTGNIVNLDVYQTSLTGFGTCQIGSPILLAPNGGTLNVNGTATIQRGSSNFYANAFGIEFDGTSSLPAPVVGYTSVKLGTMPFAGVNTCRFEMNTLTSPAAITLTSPAYITADAIGAVNLTAGGAALLSAGGTTTIESAVGDIRLQGTGGSFSNVSMFGGTLSGMGNLTGQTSGVAISNVGSILGVSGDAIAVISDISMNGHYIQPGAIKDISGATGTAGQVLTAGTGGQVKWSDASSGITTLSVSGDFVVANPGGSAADISATSTVSATATKTTKLSYDGGILLTTVDGDFDIKSGITQKILLATSGDITATGTLNIASITDASGSQGAAGQVLTAGVAGGALEWSSTTGAIGPTGPQGPAGTPFQFLATTTGAAIVQPDQFTLGTGQECFFGNSVPLANGAVASWVPPVVINSDYLDYGCFIPSKFGYLMYPGSGPTVGAAVPVQNGSAEFGDQFPYNVGDSLALDISSSGVRFLKNGTIIHTYGLAAPLTAQTNFLFNAPVAADGPYTTTQATLYAFGTMPVPGPTGPTGPVGATGATGPFSQALANKLLIDEVSDPSGGVVNLTWSTGNPPNVYVPYAVGTANTTLAPIDPSGTGTGWRFAKTYSAPNIATGVNPLVSGATYTIITVGNPVLNWVAMGASAATAGTQFLYNGVAPVGGVITPGTAYASTKISWYSLNALYGLGLPQTIVPPLAIKKKNLRNAWFLVKMNSDVALQGSFAIQIETYAYQFGGNGSNDYTGRWAYSLPLQQSVGFNAATTTNITTAAGLLFPRLRSGFTYLLYAGDVSPSYLPLQAAGSYMVGGAGLFSPSQVSTENTLRDPYNLYVSTPHFGLTATAYTPNATQPAYGGSSPYTDPADVEVASIYLNTSSTSPPVGTGQQTMDFNVMAFGYSGLVESSGTEQTFSYSSSWV